ncbi:MAG: hemolysin family protein [Acidimicrobiaceae bacterium]|jgi:putative hemolysin|nr:hemolysin family protein [Ilumatobacteraceae bacterium]
MIASAPTTIDWWMLFAIGVLLLVLIVLSIAEMGLSRVSKPKAQALADSGARGGAALLALVTQPERWVNPLLLSVNVCQTIQATLTGVVAGRLFGAVGVAVGVVLNVVVFFVFAEAVPKTYAVLHSDRAALSTSRLVSLLVAFWPLRMVSRALIGLTNIVVKGKGLEKGPFIGEQEFLGIVEAAAEEEIIEHEERELIESIIEFGDTVVREIMRPKPDIISVDAGSSIDDALDEAFEHGVSRLPVMREDDEGNEDVLGIIYAKDLMRRIRAGEGGLTVDSLVRPAIVIPENKPVAKLMREMQREHFHMAIVADEYGSIVGLVTLEDCLEELVGEIVDEHDDEVPVVRQLPNGESLVDAGMAISEFNDHFRLKLEDDEFDTVGGYLFGTLEHVPVVGESIQVDGWRIVVEALEGRRITEVRLKPVLDDD